jgi:hypothetical protein
MIPVETRQKQAIDNETIRKLSRNCDRRDYSDAARCQPYPGKAYATR